MITRYSNLRPNLFHIKPTFFRINEGNIAPLSAVTFAEYHVYDYMTAEQRNPPIAYFQAPVDFILYCHTCLIANM